MKRSMRTFLAHHLRLGYISGLLVLDASALLFLLNDVRRFKNLDLSIILAFRLSIHSLQTYIGRYCLFVTILLALVLPIILAVFRVVAGPYPRASRVLGKRNKSVLCLHLTCALIIGYSPALTTAMSLASGYKGTSGTGYAFASYSLEIGQLLFSYGFGYLLAALTLVYTILVGIVSAGTPPQWLKHYNLKLSLADLGGELYPISGRHLLNFNMPAVAPEIRCVRYRAEQIFRTYQQRIPGSESSAEYIIGIATHCKSLLKQFLVPPGRHADFSVEFFPTTSRALEVAIARIQAPNKTIVLSPFEHPTENVVSDWACFATGSTIKALRWTWSEFNEKWDKQKARLVAQIAETFTDKSSIYVLILSEVCYATGMVIPVREVVDAVRAGNPDVTLKVIVDGAHAAGNRLTNSDGPTSSDAYVTSAHKWLMSPEPCGILFLHKTAERGPRPYDSWGDDLPKSTASVHMVAGLMGSLELIEDAGFEALWLRSTELRDRFLKQIEKRLDVVAKASGLHTTLMVAVRPGPGSCWKFNAELLSEYLNNRSVFAKVVDEIDPSVPWVRVSFPYFLDIWSVDKLAVVLENAIREC